jgi:hypothetical protein
MSGSRIVSMITMLKDAERLKMRRWIADWMTWGEIPWYIPCFPGWELSTLAIAAGKEQEFLDDNAVLVSRGCDPAVLLTVLELGKTMKDRAALPRNKVPQADKVKAIASRMRRLAKEIREVESNGFMTILNHQETSKVVNEKGLNPDEIDDLSFAFPFVAVDKWLDKRADMYEEWGRLASKKIPPKDIGLSRIGHLCVALYVRYSTGKSYCPQVVKLLDSAGLGLISVTQLSREMKEFLASHPKSCGYLKMQFKLMEQEQTRENSKQKLRSSIKGVGV